RPARPSMAALGTFVRSPVPFAAARNVLELSRELVEAPLPSGQAELARHSDEVMSRALLQIDPQNLAQRVRGIVLDHLVDGEPTQATVARTLGVGLPTLQRRLAGGTDLVRRHRSADAPRSGDRLSARAGLVGHRGRLLSRLRRRQQLLARLSTLDWRLAEPVCRRGGIRRR